MADVDVVQQMYDAMATRDVARLFDLLSPDCVITQDARLPWGGRYEGHDGFATFATTLTGTIYSMVTHEGMFEADGEVIQFGHTRGTVKATGRAFDIAEVHRWTIRDGRVSTAHFAIDTPAMLQALSG